MCEHLTIRFQRRMLSRSEPLSPAIPRFMQPMSLSHPQAPLFLTSVLGPAVRFLGRFCMYCTVLSCPVHSRLAGRQGTMPMAHGPCRMSTSTGLLLRALLPADMVATRRSNEARAERGAIICAGTSVKAGFARLHPPSSFLCAGRRCVVHQRLPKRAMWSPRWRRDVSRTTHTRRAGTPSHVDTRLPNSSLVQRMLPRSHAPPQPGPVPSHNMLAQNAVESALLSPTAACEWLFAACRH